MGILERLEEKIDSMLIILEGLEFNQAVTEPFGTSPEPAIEPVVATPPPATDVELDSAGNYWEESLHSATKTKTAKGIFTKRRGLDKKIYEAGLATQKNQEVAPLSPVMAVSPVVAAPPVPETPVVATPVVPSIEPSPDAKKKCMTSINDLTQSYGVDYDFLLATISPDVKNFNDLPVDKFETSAVELKAWVDWLGMCDDESVKIEKMGKQAGLDGMAQIYGQFNAAKTPSEIDPKKLSLAYDTLKDYRAKWDAIQ